MSPFNSSSRPVILAVDDDPDNLKMVSRLLEHENLTVVTASSGQEALAKLIEISPSIVLLDINMPGIDGLETLRRLRQRQQYISVIFVSARGDKQDIIRGLDLGADDYITKPFDPLELLARVRTQLRIKDLHDKLTLANNRLQDLVDIDDLTGLFNMRSIYQKIENEIARAGRYSRAVGLVMMDIDDFKRVNDTHDHLFGSYVLSTVGKVIRNNIRQVDFGARYGGDEFLICLSETEPKGAEKFCERFRKTVEALDFSSKNDTMKLTLSLGLAVIEPHREPVDARTLVRSADIALYEAKRSGKNKVCVFDNSKLSEAMLPNMDVKLKRRIL
jgi:two-component system, cell cycle response regulator